MTWDPHDTPEAVLRKRYSAFSPDGHWFAYTSFENGSWQVFVQPFPTTGVEYQISPAGGRDPLWSPDSRQLFYNAIAVGGDGNVGNLVAVELRTQPTFSFGPPTPIPIKQAFLGGSGRYYDVTPDGRRFLVVMPASALSNPTRPVADQINVVLNWFTELQQRVPTR